MKEIDYFPTVAEGQEYEFAANSYSAGVYGTGRCGGGDLSAVVWVGFVVEPLNVVWMFVVSVVVTFMLKSWWLYASGSDTSFAMLVFVSPMVVVPVVVVTVMYCCCLLCRL